MGVGRTIGYTSGSQPGVHRPPKRRTLGKTAEVCKCTERLRNKKKLYQVGSHGQKMIKNLGDNKLGSIKTESDEEVDPSRWEGGRAIKNLHEVWLRVSVKKIDDRAVVICK